MSWVKWIAYVLVFVVLAYFVWDARSQLLPGLDVRVHDAYVAGNVVKR